MSEMLKDLISNDMKTAMKAKDTQRLAAIRLLMAAIKQKEVDERVTLDDEAIIPVIAKMIKQRQESITQYKAGGRDDLVATEQAEIEVLHGYLPQALSAEAIAEAIAAAIIATEAKGMPDMGRVMNHLRPTLTGRADLSLVSAQIKQALA